MPATSNVCLSIIVTVVGGPSLLKRCLESLSRQVDPLSMEILVPFDSTCREITHLQAEFPPVQFLDMGVIRVAAGLNVGAESHELYDRRKSYGLCRAKGEIVALLDDSGVPDQDWCKQLIEAHLLPSGAIGGAVEQASRRLLNWAVFFQDFGRYQLPLVEGPARYLTDINVSYKRSALEPVKSIWAERYNEIIVHQALIQAGDTLWLKPGIIVRQDRGKLRFGELILERYFWGRLFGSVRARSTGFQNQWFYIVFSPGIFLLLLGRIAGKVLSGGRNRLRFLMSLPLLIPLVFAWVLGELVGTLTLKE